MRILYGTILAVAVVAVGAVAGCVEKATTADFALVKGDPDPGDAVLRHVSAFTMAEDLKPGVYLAAVRVRAAARAATGDLAAWLQTSGVDKSWEAMRPAALRNGEWHTLTSTAWCNLTKPIYDIIGVMTTGKRSSWRGTS